MTLGTTPAPDPAALISAAREAATTAYAPYSQFPVGAAVLTESGQVVTGANVENASYGLTLCAERVALVKAVTEGHRKILALAVWADRLPHGAVTPCGACRQVMLEFMPPEAPVFSADPQTGTPRTRTLSELLPEAFSRLTPLAGSLCLGVTPGKKLPDE